MKYLPALLLSVLVAILPARADLTIVQQVKQEGGNGGPDVTVTTLTKGHLARVDINPEMTSIVDLSTGDTISLLHPQKIAVKIPAAVLKKMQAAHPMTTAGPSKMGELKDTGEKETISGFACEKYETTIGDAKANIWITKDAASAQKTMSDLAALAGDGNPFSTIMKQQNLPGFPVRTVVQLPEGGTLTSTITSLDSKALPDSDFTIPDGYQEQALPAMPPQ